MGDRITRRDFIDGMAASMAALSLGPVAPAAAQGAAYPPALTGLAGSAPGSFRKGP